MTALLLVLLFGVVGADDALRVLPERIDGVAPRDMMSRYLRGEARAAFERARREREETVAPLAIASRLGRLRLALGERLGGFPERTPLNVRVVGTVERSGYTVEKLIFESQPQHFVTALLFLPAARDGRVPAVVISCGHADEAKGYGPYQTAAALLALEGIAALVHDPIDQGERHQLVDENGHYPFWGTRGHTMAGVGSILLGENVARYEVWDGMRAIDVLQERPEIDPERIGCMGQSGGGTQTAQLMALDDRIRAAAPACYITSFERLLDTAGAQDAEQNVYGQLALGLDHAEYLTLRAPSPVLIAAASGDFFDIGGTWNTYRTAKRCFGRLGFPERVDLVEADGGHGYGPLIREASARWMLRWLAGRDEAVSEPRGEHAIVPLTAEEYRCTPRGEVMLLDGARSVYDLNRDTARRRRKARESEWRQRDRARLLATVRQRIGVPAWDALPAVTDEPVGEIVRDGYRIDKLRLVPEAGIVLPALHFVPAQPSRGAILYLNEDGMAAAAAVGGPIERLVAKGHRVLAVDLRGVGETRQRGQRYFQPDHGGDGQDFYLAYLLGRSYVGMRATDVLTVAKWLQSEVAGDEAEPVEMIAVGDVGIPALHAAALEPRRFRRVVLRRTLTSYSDVVEKGRVPVPLTSVVHGALRLYDLPDLAATLGKTLVIEEPVDARGEVVATGPR